MDWIGDQMTFTTFAVLLRPSKRFLFWPRDDIIKLMKQKGIAPIIIFIVIAGILILTGGFYVSRKVFMPAVTLTPTPVISTYHSTSTAIAIPTAGIDNNLSKSLLINPFLGNYYASVNALINDVDIPANKVTDDENIQYSLKVNKTIKVRILNYTNTNNISAMNSIVNKDLYVIVSSPYLTSLHLKIGDSVKMQLSSCTIFENKAGNITDNLSHDFFCANNIFVTTKAKVIYGESLSQAPHASVYYLPSSYPSPISWNEGQIHFDLADIKLGLIIIAPSIYPFGTIFDETGSPYPSDSVLYGIMFDFKASSSTNPSFSSTGYADSIRRLVDEKGNLVPPNSNPFSNQVVFVIKKDEVISAEGGEYVFTTGGESNIFFYVRPKGNGLLEVGREPTSEND